MTIAPGYFRSTRPQQSPELSLPKGQNPSLPLPQMPAPFLPTPRRPVILSCVPRTSPSLSSTVPVELLIRTGASHLGVQSQPVMAGCPPCPSACSAAHGLCPIRHTHPCLQRSPQACPAASHSTSALGQAPPHHHASPSAGTPVQGPAAPLCYLCDPLRQGVCAREATPGAQTSPPCIVPMGALRPA